MSLQPFCTPFFAHLVRGIYYRMLTRPESYLRVWSRGPRNVYSYPYPTLGNRNVRDVTPPVPVTLRGKKVKAVQQWSDNEV